MKGAQRFMSGAREMITMLDGIGIDVGSTHVSLFTAIRAVFVTAIVIVLARVISRIARRFIRRIATLDPTQQLLAEKLISTAIWIFAILTGIDVLGISFTALTVFSGAFGLAIGFGLQKTFGNMIAGLILLMDRSIKPGDVIAVEGGHGNSIGQVKKIGLRAVLLTTADNRQYLIPNEILMTSQVENWSHSSRDVSIAIPISITYGSDIALAEKLLLQAAHSAPRVLADPPPGVLLKDFGAKAIEMQVSVWINDPEAGIANVRSEVLKAAWQLFQDHGVELPLPQTDVHLIASDGLDRLIAAITARGE